MKKKPTKPVKIANLLEVIKACIETGQYRSCLHLEQRELERSITRREVLYVLLHGFHEKKEDDFDEAFQSWHYAIRGKTIDGCDLRVFVSFDTETLMIIITTFTVGIGKWKEK